MDAVPVQAPVPPFAVILPGSPLLTEFQCLDEFRWITPLGNAPELIVIFLTAPIPQQPRMAFGVYVAREDNGIFAYIGHISNERPSTVLRVPSAFLNVDNPVRLVLGISQARMEDVENLGVTQEQPMYQEHAATKLAMTERIVEDFFNFVASYGRMAPVISSDAASEETVCLPISFVKRWRDRVLTKMRKDASFWN